jgi:hypothetical protein
MERKGDLAFSNLQLNRVKVTLLLLLAERGPKDVNKGCFLDHKSTGALSLLIARK